MPEIIMAYKMKKGLNYIIIKLFQLVCVCVNRHRTSKKYIFTQTHLKLKKKQYQK